MTVEALETLDVSKKDAERAKNMFALGLLSWMYSRPYESTLGSWSAKFATRPDLVAANIAAFKAGWNFGETTEDFAVRYEVKPAKMAAGNYRNITGNAALALGLVAAGVRAEAAGLPRRLPDHPGHRHPARAEQAQAVRRHHGAGRGRDRRDRRGARRLLRRRARRDHHLSGPGVALKGETISLAVALELPLVIIDVQRAGPSTGMPTKTEQADLNMALYGRHGEAPGRGDRAALARRLLRRRDRGGPHRADLPHAGASCSPTATSPTAPSRGCCPRSRDLPDLRTSSRPSPTAQDGTTFLPYLRDPVTLARPWAVPGTPGLEHRIGGLEKADKTGDISYDPANHDFMVRTRAARIEAIEVPDVRGRGPRRHRARAGARLGLHLRPDRRRLPGPAPARAADRAGAPAAPVADAAEPRRRCSPPTTRWSSRR